MVSAPVPAQGSQMSPLLLPCAPRCFQEQCSYITPWGAVGLFSQTVSSLTTGDPFAVWSSVYLVQVLTQAGDLLYAG